VGLRALDWDRSGFGFLLLRTAFTFVPSLREHRHAAGDEVLRIVAKLLNEADAALLNATQDGHNPVKVA
jgi:hypothetical protein